MTLRDCSPPSPTNPTTSIATWLASPTAYPQAPKCVEHVETHISHVFLVGDDVYKLKKPVRYDFLDFSTLAKREFACREEVRLNRRLAPETYRGVVPVTLTETGDLQLGGAGRIVEWLVHMRRLPTDQTLEALHQQGRLQPGDIDRLAGVLVRFYGEQPPLAISPREYRARFIAHVRANLHALLAVQPPLPCDAIDRVHTFQLQLLLLQPELFDERVELGRIVDGHGDLRPEHICLTDPPAIFDCIEFRDEFRQNDIADELAFLMAECDFLGAGWVGPRLRSEYEQRTGDHPPDLLWAFYRAYRTCVRAKVATLRSVQQQGDAHDAAIAEARVRLQQADEYVAPWLRPLVIAVGGAAGTGKSTLARAVAEKLGAQLLRTDVIRKEIFQSAGPEPVASVDLYREQARKQVYAELFQRAAALQAKRVPVVLDATFSWGDAIRQAQQIAAIAGGRFLAIECVCRPEIARQRIGQRLEAGTDASDARPEVHDLQRKNWESWPTELPQIRVDTEQPLEENVENVIGALRAK